MDNYLFLDEYRQNGGEYIIPDGVLNTLLIDIEDLQQENQELKKKLEESRAVADTNSELADSIDEYHKKKRKEFIEYLEEPIRIIKQGNPVNITEYTSAKLDTLEEILSKYKEIIDTDINVGERGDDKQC